MSNAGFVVLTGFKARHVYALCMSCLAVVCALGMAELHTRRLQSATLAWCALLVCLLPVPCSR